MWDFVHECVGPVDVPWMYIPGKVMHDTYLYIYIYIYLDTCTDTGVHMIFGASYHVRQPLQPFLHVGRSLPLVCSPCFRAEALGDFTGRNAIGCFQYCEFMMIYPP